MPNINPLTAVLVIMLAVPIIKGAFMRISQEGVQNSLFSLLDSITFLFSLFVSIFLTKKIFFEHPEGIFKQIYLLIPDNFRTILYGRDVLIYLITIPIILMLLSAVWHPLCRMLNRVILIPLADDLYSLMASGGTILKSIIGTLVQLPKAAFMIFIVGMAFNFLVYYFPSPVLSGWMNDSGLYQTLYREALSPVLNSNLAKKVPVILNDSFARTMNDAVTGSGKDLAESVHRLSQDRVIVYFNGVTLDQAVESNAEIDDTALRIVGNEKNSTQKAYLLYKWVAQNIKYDYDKAARISSDSKGIASGSIVTFNTRKGICFDYSSLYVSMCRAVGLKVRLITGLGYSGMNWGDHAWNQVYSSAEGRWINVDATFGSNGNYFDKPDFSVDHRYAEVQGEW